MMRPIGDACHKEPTVTGRPTSRFDYKAFTSNPWAVQFNVINNKGGHLIDVVFKKMNK